MRLSSGRRAVSCPSSLSEAVRRSIFLVEPHDFQFTIANGASKPDHRSAACSLCVQYGRLKENLVERTEENSHLKSIATLAFVFPRRVDV
jgi:hypothetical protein